MSNERAYAVFTAERLRDLFSGCGDVRNRLFYAYGRERSDEADIALFYCEGMIDDSDLRRMLEACDRQATGLPALPVFLMERLERPTEQELVNLTFSGSVLCYVREDRGLYCWSLADLPQRKPDESNTETSIRGPKDSMIEDITANAALIRKRLRTRSLHYETFVAGRLSQTRVGLFYIKGKARDSVVASVRERINGLDLDTLISCAQLEQLLSDDPSSLFPLVDYTGRPDFAADCLLRGRVVIIMDGAPNALIMPVNFFMLLKSPEDANSPFIHVALERIVRLAAFIVSVLLIGLWIALINFHQEQLPFSMLATVVVSRQGIPLTVPMEAFCIIALFEILREAGARLPKGIGQTLAVVGGLIIGDAAIRSGLASPTLVVIAAITTISTFVLVNVPLSSNVTILRLFVLALSSIFGIYGFLFATLIILLYISRLESFGMPYLTPLSPLKLRELVPALLQSRLSKFRRLPKTVGEDEPIVRGGRET